MDNKIKLFTQNYINHICKGFDEINYNSLLKIINEISNSISKKKTIFICGNGGSAAISKHYICDYLKLIRQNTKLKPKIISLSDNIETITAIANDFNYDKVFSYQLESLSEKGDLVILISSSGNSKNILNAAKVANKNRLKVISFTGFSGGKLKKLSDLNVNINLSKYGLVEDAHHILMHVIMHFIVLTKTKKKKLIL